MKPFSRRELLKASPWAFMAMMMAGKPAKAFFMNGGAANPAAPTNVTQNAANIYAPGFNDSSPTTSTGAASTYSGTFTNSSGAAITVGSLCLSGWYLTTSGTSPVGNTMPVTGNIEYPIGVTQNTMTSGGSSTITVPNGTDLVTDQITLATPIPAGASFKVNLACTLSSGLFYNVNLGLSGVMTTALSSTLTPLNLFIVGDSIMTNNSGPVTVAAVGRCPSSQMSIIGTTAAEYATSSPNFARQVSLAKTLGCTHFVSNFATNDLAGGTTYTQLLTYLQTMRSQAAAVGIKWVQTTLTPRTSIASITPSSVTSSGNSMSVTVPNASLFVVGEPYTVSGITQTEYNGVWGCTAVNTSTNVVTLLFPGSGTPTATGSPSIRCLGWSNNAMQAPISATFAAGGSSPMGLFNAAIRGGAFDSYIEWADACMTSRDSGIWPCGGQKTELPGPAACTITTGFTNTATRFQTTSTLPANTVANGYGQFTSGANIGYSYGANGNSGGNYTSNTAFPNVPSIGDGFMIYPGTNSPSDDGLHPRVNSGSYGGAQLLNDASITWVTANI